MAWRMVKYGNREWHVSVAAERRERSERWNLVLSFKAQDGDRRLLWTEYPMSSSSRSALLQQAERIPASRLAQVLADSLNSRGRAGDVEQENRQLSTGS